MLPGGGVVEPLLLVELLLDDEGGVDAGVLPAGVGGVGVYPAGVLAFTAWASAFVLCSNCCARACNSEEGTLPLGPASSVSCVISAAMPLISFTALSSTVVMAATAFCNWLRLAGPGAGDGTSQSQQIGRAHV